MIGRILRQAALAASALAMSAALAAARRPPDPELSSPEAIRTLHDFGACLARNHSARSRVADILTMDLRTEAARDAVRDLIGEHDPCVASSRVFYYVTSSSSLLFAGAIAEAYLPRDRDLATLVAYDPARPPLQAHSELEVMSLCTVRAAPAAVAGLFATQPATPEEAAALRALAPQLGQCLRAGTQSRVNGPEVRAMLALAAWRLAAANGATAGR